MNTAEHENDIRKRLENGDLSALELLWDHYANDLLGYLVSLLCSRHDAEDVLQEVFVTIARKQQALVSAKKMKPYLFRLARNTAYNRSRKHSRRKQREQESCEWLEPVDSDSAAPEYSGDVADALSRLPEKQRVVIVLKHFGGKTFVEIAASLDLSANTVASRYRYGMNKLEGALQGVRS